MNTVILTIHNRPAAVSQAVAASLAFPGNRPDMLVVVMDRPLDYARAGAMAAYQNVPCPVEWVEVQGTPDVWLCPARAWNSGFARAAEVNPDGTWFVMSSEVVLDKDAVDIACSESGPKTVVFGSCHNSVPRQLVTGAAPGLLVSSTMPRPLGFLAALPATKVREIGGFDDAFMEGFWFDDDDFFFRLWNAGCNFMWDDRAHGTHLDHDRPSLDTAEGQNKITINRARMSLKYGRPDVWSNLPKRVTFDTSKTIWTHA